MEWRVVCRIRSRYGDREMTVWQGESREEAERVAQILQEGADSNPRSNATFTVEERPTS
jgi:hypothetical protein